MWLFSFPSTIYWRDYPFSIVCSLLLCCKLTVHICVDLFLSSQFCFIDLCMFFCQYHDILITLALKSSMRSGLWYHHLLFLKDTNVLLTKIKPSFHLKWVEAENPGLVTPNITFFLLLKLFNFFSYKKTMGSSAGMRIWLLFSVGQQKSRGEVVKMCSTVCMDE